MTSGSGILKAGVVGLGDIAKEHHLPMYDIDPRVTIEAICDLDPKNREEVEVEYDVQSSFKEAKQLITSTELDLVSICTPPNTHKDFVIEAAQNNTAILCEKPTAVNVDDAQKMIAEINNAGVQASGGYILQFFPVYERALSQVEYNIIGEIKKIDVTYYHTLNESKEWKLDPNISGGGVVIDILPHVLSFIFRFIDRDVRVEDATINRYARQNIESDINIRLQIGDVPVSIKLGRKINGGPRKFNIRGSDGDLEITDRFETLHVNDETYRYARSGPPKYHIGPQQTELRDPPFLTRYSPYHGENEGRLRIKSFIDTVCGTSENQAPLRDCIEILSTVRTIYEQTGIESPLVTQ